jgi:hypothetical protein
MHDLLGYDTAASFMGVPAGDKADCLLCAGREDEWLARISG